MPFETGWDYGHSWRRAGRTYSKMRRKTTRLGGMHMNIRGHPRLVVQPAALSRDAPEERLSFAPEWLPLVTCFIKIEGEMRCVGAGLVPARACCRLWPAGRPQGPPLRRRTSQTLQFI